jgi:hypothetical protein
MTMPSRSGGNRPLRAALYERVSSEEQVEGYSLDAQDRAGRLYCETHDLEVVHVYRDEGRSARTDDLSKRPAFRQMLYDAEAGLFDASPSRPSSDWAKPGLVSSRSVSRWIIQAHKGN